MLLLLEGNYISFLVLVLGIYCNFGNSVMRFSINLEMELLVK